MKQTKQTLYRSDLSTHKAIVSSFTKGAILSKKKGKVMSNISIKQLVLEK